MSSATPLRVAIVGAGPAGIYAGNILSRAVAEASDAENPVDLTIDLFESLPAPYGLIRYGVAPDHPRIKGIVNSLHEMLDGGSIRLIGNVTVGDVEAGADVSVDELRAHYHAVIFATGAIRDVALDIPGIDLPGSFGAADVVNWYDGHPDVDREWPLEATEIAVLGNGNVALDVARVLVKHAKDLLSTDIPATVHAGLAASPVTDVHVFGRRGPAHVKFTPIELRELGEIPDVDLIVYDDDFVAAEGDAHAEQLAASNNQVKVMTRTLNAWRTREHGQASRRLHLHFLHNPVEITGDGRVEGIRFERTAPVGDGTVRGTGEFVDYPVQAVYRAIGYFGSPIAGLPFDEKRGVIPNEGGRVVDAAGAAIPGVYATGWIKRGPVGLIGHTKGDALETITHLLADVDALPAIAEHGDILDLLDGRGIRHTSWQGWLALDEHERALGAAFVDPEQPDLVRERVKVIDREEQVVIQRGACAALDAVLVAS